MTPEVVPREPRRSGWDFVAHYLRRLDAERDDAARLLDDASAEMSRVRWLLDVQTAALIRLRRERNALLFVVAVLVALLFLR